MPKKLSEIQESLIEKDEHKQSNSYKKLTPKMKRAVDEIFSTMDKRANDFLSAFEGIIRKVSQKYKVTEKEIYKYFEQETSLGF